jgi:surface antigen Omp85-like protein
MTGDGRGTGTLLCVAVVTLSLALPAIADAQDTRAEQIAAKQREKAQKLAPYQPNGFERAMTRIEANFASPPSGFFPSFNSIYSGGGFTFGGGYRRFFKRNAVWDVVGHYSIKNYKQIEVGARTPWAGHGKWTLGVRAGWLDAPQVGYFGTGGDLDQPRTNFRLSQSYATLTATVRPTTWTRLEGEVAYEAYETDEGHGAHPSIETIYTPATAPGLFANPTFIRTEGMAAIDWRPATGYARRGGFYGVTFANLADLDDTFTFQRLDGEVIQHIPILRETWVISLRGRVQTTLDAGDVVPYFLLPQLGSGSTLRGYSTGRVRDRHSLLTSAEFRWIPSRLALDLALFYDAGKVANRREDLDFEDLVTNWGLGVRFHGPTTTALRIELAHGSDGLKLVFAASAAF